MSVELAIYKGPAGDRNILGFDGARLLSVALSKQFSLDLKEVGNAKMPLGDRWEVELEYAKEDLRKLASHIRATYSNGDFPITVSSRCAASLATLPEFAKAHANSKVIWFDAHADLNIPSTSSTAYLGGMVISGAAGLWQSGLGDSLSLDNVILVGSRDIDPYEQGLINSGRICHIEARVKNIKQALTKAIGSSSIYIHLDCDVLEPGLVPTEYEVPNGLSYFDLKALFTILAEYQVVGFEIAEFQSRWIGNKRLASTNELIEAIRPVITSMNRSR